LKKGRYKEKVHRVSNAVGNRPGEGNGVKERALEECDLEETVGKGCQASGGNQKRMPEKRRVAWGGLRQSGKKRSW